MSDFDPTDAAARAVGAQADGDLEAEAEPSTTADHAAAEGTEASDDVGSADTLREMLLSDEPDTPLTQVESPWNPDEGGLSRIYRGIQKMAGIAGMPAIADLAIGAVEVAHDLRDQLPDDEDGADQEDVDDDGDQDAGELGGVASV